MKGKWKALTATVVGAIMAVSAVAFAACGDGETEEEFEEDNVMPINIQDDYATDKVVTAGFSVGNITEDKSAFTLPKLVADNMLLQANVTNKVWGATTENGSIAVQILKNGKAEATYYGTAADGDFLVYVGGHDYGTGYTVRIVAESGKSVSLTDVAFGELWLGAGQSNMGWTMQQCYKKTISTLLYQSDINKSQNDDIRLFQVYNNNAMQGSGNSRTTSPVDEIARATGWQKANPDTVASFSAAAYFFARELNAQYNVPIGVIQSCMGGTAIHTWLPESVFSEGVVGHCDANADYIDSSYFNGMIYPLRNETVRGVLWYQGEGDYNHYDVNYGLLMKSWRKTFGRDNIWFTTVTLPRFPNADAYFECREQQMAASVKDLYASYSVNIDCGLLPKDVAEGDTINPDGIHPYDKKPVGTRAAHVTMRDLYGAKGVWSGPTFKSAKVSGNKVEITFGNVGKGLVLTGKFGFEIADKSNPKVYTRATVSLVQKATNKIVVFADGVSNPVSVIYGRENADLDAIDSYAECVCLYNTKTDIKGDYAYPAEQFVWTKK